MKAENKKPLNQSNYFRFTPKQKRFVWITRSFLDYRIPVYKSFDKLVNHQFYLVYSKEYIPNRVHQKITAILGDRAIGLSGEWKFGDEDNDGMANSIITFRYNPKLYKTIKNLKPDVLISDGFFKWSLAAVIFKCFNRTPHVICYERTFHTERNAQWFRTLFRKLIVKRTDAMCCNGMLCGEYSQFLGMAPNKITYGHMAADTDHLSKLSNEFTNDQKMALKSKLGIKGLLFIYVGSLSYRKGVKELLKAWTAFEKKYNKNVSLLLIGSGDIEHEINKYAESQILKSVSFLGSIDYDNISRYYATADIFIMPTLEDNWSLVVPEAMACGLPVLCSKYNGCWPEMIEEGKNGWVFDPVDTNGTMNALELAYKEKDNLKEMGKYSQHIIRNFTPGIAADSIFKACKIALNRK